VSFNANNITPRQIALLIAFFIAVPETFLVYYFHPSYIWASVSFIGIFLASYGLISFALERFIYRKIKLIYKFINKTKASKKEETYYNYILPRKSIDEVRIDVENWAAENEKEVELLRHNEQFRKEFLQNLSHELKTPVFAIQGYIELLSTGVIDTPELREKYLKNTSKNIARLTNLLGDLDEISKLERGEVSLTKQTFVIQDLVKEVFDSLTDRAEKAKITCRIKKGSESALTVFADRSKIRQVISNLVENSIKYGKPNGSIQASMYKTYDNHILIEITDDGIGIPEKEITRIFERFYRTEEGRSMDVSGSGLGLSICKHIIEAHGETIHARSTEGIGTTIGFTLETK
jgi:two-component system phosphate regulon sensor histidine kinase PhoR